MVTRIAMNLGCPEIANLAYIVGVLLLFSLFLFFSILHLLRTWGFLMIGENHFFKNLFSNSMTWNDMVITMDILAVDAHSGMELCTPI
jgi:hypothetical protein